MKYQVKLRLFQDDANGEWGLAHDNAIDRGFNAFWTQQGIFHDVFEHYFEDNHKYFRGCAAFNLGGEVAAMGHLAYYSREFYLEKRRFRNNSTDDFESNIMYTTLHEMVESVQDGNFSFGIRFISTVPRIKRRNWDIEDLIDRHWEEYSKKAIVNPESDYVDECYEYKKSLTKANLASLYRWGYREASKIAPSNYENRQTLEKFLEEWEYFVQNNKAEELANVFRYITFTIYGGANLRWKAEWTTQDNQTIKHSKYIMDDVYSLDY